MLNLLKGRLRNSASFRNASKVLLFFTLRRSILIGLLIPPRSSHLLEASSDVWDISKGDVDSAE